MFATAASLRRGIPRQAVLFFLWALLLGALAWSGAELFKDPLYAGTASAMLAPALAALIVLWQADGLASIRARAHSWAQSELRLTARAAHGVVLTFAMACAGLVLTLVVGHGSRTPLLSFVSSLGSVGLLFVLYLLPALAEEIGWRGFLLDRLSHLGAARAAALTGLAWGLWHAPAIALMGFDYPSHHVLGILAICAFTVPFGIVLAWLRRSSGTLLAPAVAHATLNAMMPALAASLPHSDSLLASPMGLLGAAPFAVLALHLLARGAFESPRAQASVPVVRAIAVPA